MQYERSLYLQKDTRHLQNHTHILHFVFFGVVTSCSRVGGDRRLRGTHRHSEDGGCTFFQKVDYTTHNPEEQTLKFTAEKTSNLMRSIRFICLYFFQFISCFRSFNSVSLLIRSRRFAKYRLM